MELVDEIIEGWKSHDTLPLELTSVILPFISSSVCVPLKITYVILYVYNTV